VRATSVYRPLSVVLLLLSFVTTSLRAQTIAAFAPELAGSEQVLTPPAGPPPTPRHTGIKAMVKDLAGDVTHLPSRENLFWVGVGAGLALAVHPIDDDLNHHLVGNRTADRVFKPGEILGELGTLLGSATAVYAVGRLKDEPRVSHVGMDLIQALALSEGLIQSLKYTTRRERPDHSARNSFPSGHAADTFAFATALERHLGWRYYVPAYVFASYVAVSRLPANRHWFSDAVFGSAVGIIAGRTVTSLESAKYPVAINYLPKGIVVTVGVKPSLMPMRFGQP
jgi:membrane-associated phospholipid phosphatase